MIHIVTGKIDSGKSTKLMELYETIDKGDGFVLLKTMDNGKPVYYDAYRLSRKTRCRTIVREDMITDESVAFAIGPYRFLTSAVAWINREMTELLQTGTRPLFFDEAGILEINKKGFYPLIKAIVESDADLYITVRTPLVEKFLETFNIQTYRIVGD